MNGGRKKWLAEKRAVTKDVPKYHATSYRAHPADTSVRAFRDDVKQAIKESKFNLVDVRSPTSTPGR